MMFADAKKSHEHSLWTLNTLYEYDDFMESVGLVIDLGCGQGLDCQWWATRTTREEEPQPLNIRCTGIDIGNIPATPDSGNIVYLKGDFEKPITPQHRTRKYDILWCHDAFQYALNPIDTLIQWRDLAEKDSMMVIIVPQTTNVQGNRLDFLQHNGTYYHYTLVNLIHMLAITGWDCRSGFFYKEANDPWIHAIVYNSDQKARDPRSTTWYDLADSGLLPESAVRSVMKHGYLKQRDLVLPWLDKNLYAYDKH